ncbi:ethylene-responsive transcription factor ERF017-like [Andrographis paniculata]|uniref:ethylene-responsive transcription factor ERF017-like n=1 Tax=Andrographis paniculata TaxID=175694 RepID=UPI0021E80F2B|nr:ethylene-responsive transcription factor ERF017-like [Andrographis paniculata]
MVKTAPAGTVSDVIKYKGVRLRKWGKYVSEIRLPNSRDRIWLGSYATAEQAARAFDAALYCLRGAEAKFNFPGDPPNIAGGQGLAPPEIRAAAQAYAEGFPEAGSDNQPPEEEEEDRSESPSAAVDLNDWSFLDALDSGGEINSDMFAGIDHYFHEPFDDDLCILPHYIGNDVAGDDDDDDGGDGQSLWMF